MILKIPTEVDGSKPKVLKYSYQILYNNFKCRFRQKTSLAIKIELSQLKFLINIQVVYTMVPRSPFSKLVLRKIKIMTDGRSVDVISGNFS